MLTTIEAEIDVNGNVTLLEPITLTKKSRAIVTVLENGSTPKKPVSEEEARLAEERFARWIGAGNSSTEGKGGKLSDLFGTASLGHATGLDNEEIDADLAREYANTHEDQS